MAVASRFVCHFHLASQFIVFFFSIFLFFIDLPFFHHVRFCHTTQKYHNYSSLSCRLVTPLHPSMHPFSLIISRQKQAWTYPRDIYSYFSTFHRCILTARVISWPRRQSSLSLSTISPLPSLTEHHNTTNHIAVVSSTHIQEYYETSFTMCQIISHVHCTYSSWIICLQTHSFRLAHLIYETGVFHFSSCARHQANISFKWERYANSLLLPFQFSLSLSLSRSRKDARIISHGFFFLGMRMAYAVCSMRSVDEYEDTLSLIPLCPARRTWQAYVCFFFYAICSTSKEYTSICMYIKRSRVVARVICVLCS